MSELKNCPFCGCNADILGEGDYLMVKCNGCGCSVVFDIDENEGLKNKIINLWNKRANKIIVNMSGDNCQSIGHVDTLTIN